MKLILRAVTSPYDDITKGSVLSHQELDTNQINLKGELIYTANSENNVITFRKINGDTIEVPFISGSGGTSTFITGGTYSNGTTELTNNTGGSISITGYSTGYTLTLNEIVDVLGYTPLSGDTFVTGGTYSNGTAIFTNNIDETFSVGGLFTTLDDIHTTGFTFNNGNYNLTIFNSDNTSFTQNLGILSSDMTITGGTYNPTTGVGTFVNNSGGTFDVSGFLTGYTDIFIVSGTSDNYTGTVTLRRSDNVDIIVTGFTSGTSINWYAENAGPPTTRPIATGLSSVALGSNAEALNGNMFVYGDFAGQNATGSTHLNLMGKWAGQNAYDTSNSNFFGQSAGRNAIGATISNFLGANAGRDATGATYSNFFGANTGNGAKDASHSNFFGHYAGSNAIGASGSTFIGQNAGINATGATNSNFFGTNTGNGSMGSNNIIIGTNISLPNNTSDGINIGGVLFGTGTYSRISDTPSITGQTNGRIGVGIVTPLETLHVSGNTRVEGGLILKTLTGSTSINNLGIDINGNVVSGQSSYWSATGSSIYYGNKVLINTSIDSSSHSSTNKLYVNGDVGISGDYRTEGASGRYAFSDGASGMYTSSGSDVKFRSYSTAGNLFEFVPIYANTVLTANTQNVIHQKYTIDPISGGSPIRMFNLEPTINQTGSTPSIIHGIRIAPTLTSAFDFRAIEVTNGKVIIPNGSSANEAVNLSQITGMTGTSISGGTFTNPNIKITLPTITGSTGEIVYFGSGTGFTAGLIYYFNSSGQWTLANATTSSSSKYLIGIALGTSITDGMLIKGYARYAVGNYSSVGTGDILYLSTTNGFFQTTAPSSSSQVVRIIGYCIDSVNDTIYFNPDNTWVEIL